MKAFLDTQWEDLLVVSYRVDPAAKGWLEEQVPAGTELDDYMGEHYVSVVAFRFRNTRMMGLRMPVYRDFAEVNLRFYVKRRVGGGWRRGVVFVKEIVPCRLPAWVANVVFKENFHVRPLRREVVGNRLRYEWREGSGLQRVEVEKANTLAEPERGSLTEHIIDHYWAYKRVGQKVTGEFAVTHRPWRVFPFEKACIQLDIAQIYGQRWAEALKGGPVHTFYADGSRVQVTKPQMLTI